MQNIDPRPDGVGLTDRRFSGHLIAQSVEEVFHLVAPQLALILDLTFVRKIFYNEDGLVRDFGFFDTELKEFFLRSVLPVKPDEFFKFAFCNLGPICRSIPGK